MIKYWLWSAGLCASGNVFGSWQIPFQDTINSTPDGLDVLMTIQWIVQMVSYLLCVSLLISTANQLSKESYSTSGLSFVAAIIAGGAPYLARCLI